MTTPSDAARALLAMRRRVPGTCERCGGAFLKYPGALYCSRRCKGAVAQARRYQRRVPSAPRARGRVTEAC